MSGNVFSAGSDAFPADDVTDTFELFAYDGSQHVGSQHRENCLRMLFTLVILLITEHSALCTRFSLMFCKVSLLHV